MKLRNFIHDDLFYQVRVDYIAFYVMFRRILRVQPLFYPQNGVRHSDTENDAGIHVFREDGRFSGRGCELQDSVFHRFWIDVVVRSFSDLRSGQRVELGLKIGSCQFYFVVSSLWVVMWRLRKHKITSLGKNSNANC